MWQPGSAVVLLSSTQPGRVQRTPRPRAWAFHIYHHTNLGQRVNSIIYWALRQCCWGPSYFRVRNLEFGNGCKWRAALIKAIGTLGIKKDDALVVVFSAVSPNRVCLEVARRPFLYLQYVQSPPICSSIPTRSPHITPIGDM